MKYGFPILALLFATGCANFEYDITRPAEFARYIGKAEERFAREPVEYRMQTVDSRLVMLIDNNSDSPVNLLGDRSSVVDEHGQSHPLRSVAIAPHSFAKVVMPPQRPYIEHNGATFGVGFGVIGSAWHRYFIDDPTLYDGPRYLAVYYDDDAYYWDWQGETEVRITIVYQQGEK